MLYNEYKSKVLRASDILKKIKKALLVALILACVIGAICAVFTLFSGTFIGKLTCENIVYGDEISCSARAFLCDVGYEFKLPDGSWTDEKPFEAGEYFAVGVTKNRFGMVRKTGPVSFIIEKRQLTLEIPELKWNYGDMVPYKASDIVASGLYPSDKLENIDFEVIPLLPGKVSVSIGSVMKILDKYERDVTSSYDISIGEGHGIINKRRISIKVYGAEKQYDGSPLVCEKYSLEQGSLADGHSLDVKITGVQTDVGSSENHTEIAITDMKGNDVTKYYDISLSIGKLTVTKRKIVIETGSAEKIYDGTSLVCDKYTVTSGELLNGHKIKVTVSGRQTNCGISANTADVTITDAYGKDCTENYDITVSEGKLTVNKRNITIKTGSAEKVYDGTPLTYEKYEIVSGSIADRQRLNIRITGSITNAGTAGNTFEASVFDYSGNDVTGNYDINAVYGKLTVSKRKIMVKTGSAEKTYDGKPLVCEEYEIKSGSLAGGHKMTLRLTGSQTRVGTSDNTAFVDSIKDRNKDSVISNYDISFEYGKLTVKEAPGGEPGGDSGDEPGGDSGDEQGGDSGGEQGGDSGDEPGGDSGGDSGGGGSVSGLSISETITIGNPPKLVYTPVLKIYSSVSGSYLRYRSYGDYTGNGFGIAKSYKKSMLSYIGKNVLSENPVQKATVRYINGASAILSPYYYYGNFDAYDSYIIGTSNEYTVYFVQNDNGILKIQPNSDEAEYRKFVYENYLSIPESTRARMLKIASENGLSSKSSIDDIANYIRSAAEYSFDAVFPFDVKDIAVYFLTVEKRGVCMHFAAAATVMYRALGIPARYVTGYSASFEKDTWTTVTADTAHAWVEVYIDGVGWMPVEVTGGNGEFEGFDDAISFAGGGGSAGEDDEQSQGGTEKYFTISTASASKIYDRKPLNYREFYISSGKLKKGHRISVIFSSGITDVGIAKNSILSYAITDENGNDVTASYGEIRILEGTLEVLPRPISISTGSAFMAYKKRALTNKEYWISSGSLADNQKLTVSMFSSQIFVGETENIYSNPKIIDYSGDVPKDVTGNYIITRGKIGTLTVY